MAKHHYIVFLLQFQYLIHCFCVSFYVDWRYTWMVPLIEFFLHTFNTQFGAIPIILRYCWLGIHFLSPLNLSAYLSPWISDLNLLVSKTLRVYDPKKELIFDVCWVALEFTMIRNLCQVWLRWIEKKFSLPVVEFLYQTVHVNERIITLMHRPELRQSLDHHQRVVAYPIGGVALQREHWPLPECHIRVQW